MQWRKHASTSIVKILDYKARMLLSKITLVEFRIFFNYILGPRVTLWNNFNFISFNIISSGIISDAQHQTYFHRFVMWFYFFQANLEAHPEYQTLLERSIAAVHSTLWDCQGLAGEKFTAMMNVDLGAAWCFPSYNLHKGTAIDHSDLPLEMQVIAPALIVF